MTDDLPQAIERACAASRFLARVRLRHADLYAPAQLGARTPGEIARTIAQAADACADEASLMQLLRLTREREMARIALRDLAGVAALDETLSDLSDLADAACAAAVEFSWRKLVARHGKPCDEQGNPSRPVILGMGKLGGRELNFSSDIDLIFCFTLNGETDGERGLSNEEFYARMVQDVTRYLSARTADGFVFRVDWMLRPFGSAGPPAISFAAAESYYQTHGREWERYAMIKARPVAGDLAAGDELLRTLRPFVYRRYLDYNAFGALRELKGMIEAEVRRKDLHDNIKLGAGGIREIEFIVQAVQLVRGGQDARLRGTQLRPLLRTLGELQLLPAETAQALDHAYVFLRRAENAIQMYDDEQAHALPASAEARAALCLALGYNHWDAFSTALDAVRARVQREFERV
ncbi:MAG TPA: bifunctional [glutamate--ammonia ligase]-adenylyl-L-tyrosine phosphorylase/[glutamate--ammonia-ligase] adenylyltransferase, partial [Nevskiaceae bacterium]|nr:bifunctional [glutamate--ammonia ligase]-adenylyl-L-tyrosine phosphorylase/[glutamate--ammonia-ligase] adenylyltransferase [Nevskiaceae bacterium]